MRFDDSSTTTGLSSKVTEKVTEIIGSLNIAKKRTDPKTWKSYYLSKGFGKLPSSALLIYLDDCIDELNELSFEDEFDDEIIGIQSEKVEELKSSILHLFRAILSLGDLSEKKEAVESILQGLDFEFDPEMSYDLSGGSVISGGELDSTLVQYLVDPIGGAANSIVRMNAVVTAFDKSSMQLCAHPHKAVEIIFDKFDEYHPEVVAVAIFGRISNESLDQSVFQKIIHILDVDYISYLGFPKEQLLKTLTNKDLLEKVNLH